MFEFMTIRELCMRSLWRWSAAEQDSMEYVLRAAGLGFQFIPLQCMRQEASKLRLEL